MEQNPLARRRDERYNYFAASVDSAGFPTGATFVALLTVIPAFLSQLTDSKWVIGGIQSLYAIGVCVPPLVAANYIQRMPRKRSFVFWVAALERLAILGLAIFTLLFGAANPGALLAMTFLMLGLNYFGMGINLASYSAMIAKVIPVERRGSLYGWSGAIGGVLCIGAAWLLDLLLKRYGFPRGYAYGFLVGFAILMLSIVPLAFIREPEERNGGTHQDWGEYWRTLVQVMRADRNFARFVASQAGMAFATMAAAFLMFHAIQRFHVGNGSVALYTGVLTGSGIVASAFWGVIIDRRGNKLVLGFGALLSALACGAAMAAPSPALYALVFVLVSFSNYAIGIASFNIVLEFCDPSDSPRYIALSTALPAPFRALAPMLGAAVARQFGYSAVFGLTGILMLASLMILLTVHEPRHLQNVPVVVER